MTSENSNPEQSTGNQSPLAFGSQSTMGLAEVLQMCCLSQRNGQITFRSGESYGFVFVQQGRVLHALCGVIEGEEAVYIMLAWPGGSFTLDEDILPHKKTIDLSWEQLLFEGARRSDGGLDETTLSGAPVMTAEPQTNKRAKDNQPKLVISQPDLAQTTVELESEYTHVGRAQSNEIPLPYPSVSNRHCIFLLSGSDVVVRDLNSSNGTYVNGEPITEATLRPGDNIQVGIISIKFEPGIRRPKLNTAANPVRPTTVSLPVEPAPSMTRTTTKLPSRAAVQRNADGVVDDEAYVSGRSAISYKDLATPETVKASKPWGIIIGVLVVLLLLGGGAVYYFVLAK